MLLQIHVRQWLARRMQKQAWKLAKGEAGCKEQVGSGPDLIEVKKAIEAEALLPGGYWTPRGALARNDSKD